MKKTLLIVLGIIVIVAISFVYWDKAKAPTVEKNKLSSDYKNSSYMIENKTVTLVDGVATTDVTQDSASKTITLYFGNEARCDFNGDGKEDVAFLLTQTGDGSGIFFYVVAALGGANGYTGTNAVLLGDRIAPQTTEFRDGEIIVNFADRKTDEPMTSAPSVGISKYLRVTNGVLIETVR